MPRFQPGDYVKAEFKDDVAGESGRMCVTVDSCDDRAGVIFERLDNGPLLGTGLHVRDKLTVSYGKVAERGKAWKFER